MEGKLWAGINSQHFIFTFILFLFFSNIDIKSIFDNIIRILTNADLTASEVLNDNNYNNTLEGIIELTRNRKNLEVTDHLWDILRCNYSLLIDFFKHQYYF